MQTKFRLAEGVVYGPVHSRRFGVSLGINFLPAGRKLCSFDCLYCQCGWSGDGAESESPEYCWPKPERIEIDVASRLASLRRQGVRLDAITISGNGEPTLHPKFLECVRAVVRARALQARGTPVGVFSNGAHLHRESVVAGMNLLDARFIKIDPGWDAVNKPLVRFRVDDLIANVRKLRGFVAQSMFVWGTMDNTRPEAVSEWIDVIGRARPLRVHIYSIDRLPADAGLLPVPRAVLRRIAATLSERTQVPAEVF